MPRKKTNKIRVEFRKKHESKARDADLTRKYEQSDGDLDTVGKERVSGKGDLTRHRTIIAQSNPSSDGLQLDGDDEETILGLVLRVHGLESVVQADNGSIYRCSVRRVLKSMSIDERHVVVAGDRVRIRVDGAQGTIHKIEPRTSMLSRTSRNRRHVLVANADQLLIVTSAAEPAIKPNLIDRFLVTTEQNRLEACICINKCDLIDPSDLQPLVASYAQIGYRVLLLSAAKGWNIEALRKMVMGRNSVVAGQSGVGKSSLLNSIEPGLHLRVQAVSQENQKGKHTTTTAELFPLQNGGAIIDTPGIRQFQLWDVSPEEVSSLYRDIRPFANRCHFPNCTHQHEIQCAVKDAVADGLLDVRRYESFCQLLDDPNNPV